MVELRHGATRISGPAGHLTALSDLLVLETAQGARLFSASGRDGGVLVHAAEGSMAPVATGHFAAGAGLAAPRGLHVITLDGQQVLLAHGRYGTALEAWELDAGGGLGSRALLRLEGAAPQAMVALAELTVGGTRYMVSADRQAPGLAVWRIEERSGALEETRFLRVDQGPAGAVAGAVAGAIQDLAVVEPVGGPPRILAISADTGSLFSYSMGAGGQLGEVVRLGAEEGLFLTSPTELSLLRVAGEDYALVGAPGNGAIAVVALEAQGGMRVTDIAGDARDTRFAGISVLEVVTLEGPGGGQSYLVAGGSDDGLSLLTLLPGGRLLHLGSIPDDLTMVLTDPSALALAVSGSGIDIFVAGDRPEAGEGEGAGITRLRVDLGAIGETRLLGDGGAEGGAEWHGGSGRDQVRGGAGDDRLHGGGGDDVLVDGAGSDRLTGGAGADIFVLMADGQRDRVTDFEPGVDRLDLSDWGRFYTLDALDIRATDRGAEIRFGAEVLRLDTRDQQPLEATDFDISDLRDLWHVDSAALPQAPLSMTGTPGADLLEGRGGDDRLHGGGGPDILRGGEGDDHLSGEAADAGFDMAAAQVYRLYRAVLDREPDSGGLLGWSAALQEGRSLVSVAGGFTGSPEFTATYGDTDNRAFVSLLYENVLGRAPDERGLASWSGQLDRGECSRESVVIGFSESAEFREATRLEAAGTSRAVLQAEWSDEVYRLYRAVLDRDPDVNGLHNWTGRLAEGTEYTGVVAGFTGSPEFRATYGEAGNRGFVTLLYGNVLDRAPDPKGLAGWTGRLEAGTSREEVVSGFAESAEFRAATAPDLLDWMRDTGADDRIEGGAGRNLLTGGLLSDCFVFRADAPARQEVVDLERWDQMCFEGFGYGEAAEAMAQMSEGRNGVTFADREVTVLLQGVALSDIHEDMILL